MAIRTIRKRDGRAVPFEPQKITAAIEKATVAVRGGADASILGNLTESVVRAAESRFVESTADVEGVQDLVEQVLMEGRLFDVARAYILYRERHREMRERRAADLLRRVELGTVSVVKRSGATESLSPEKLRRFFIRATADYQGVVDVHELVDVCLRGVTDGLSTTELSQQAVLAARGLAERDPALGVVTARLFLSCLYREVFNRKFSSDSLEDEYRRSFADGIRCGVEKRLLAPELLELDLEKFSLCLAPERDQLIGYLGLQTLYGRYLIHDPDTKQRLETPQAMWMRVAMGLALRESDCEESAARFYDVLSSLRFLCSTPTLFHSGTLRPQLSSCYLTTVDDDLAHIFKCLGDNAQLSKWSGGLGTDWTCVRATGAPIRGTGVESQGVIPFLKIANDATIAINRSGKRRGAACAYLEVWHLDIEDFIDLRRNTGDERRRTHDLHTAAWIPDLFFKRVLEDGDWTLFSPDDVPELHHDYGRSFDQRYTEAESRGLRLCRRIKARELWRKILTRLYETGGPWITFKDAANVRSPQDHAGVIHSSNLCTEITLNTSVEETAVCNLGSANLSRHIGNGELDVDLLAETVRTAMRMLDNVIDLNFYPTPEAERANLRHRPVGLGVMGLQDALFELDIAFDTEEALAFSDWSMEVVAYHAIDASADLARERGRYESYPGSKWDRGILPIDTLDLLAEERGQSIDVPRNGRLDWLPLREKVATHGMRNSNCLAIAPTATIANIAGCFPSIEPAYKNIYVKSNMSGEFTVVNEYLVKDLKALGIWNRSTLEELKARDGCLRDIERIPLALKAKYKTAFEIEPEWLIHAAARRGKWIDQSQSLNLFVETRSGRRLFDMYIQAWMSGLKTTYYLRTLGASAIEKSTVRLADPLDAARATASCSIEDPTCEACQ